MLADELTKKEFKAYLTINHKGWTIKDLHLRPSSKIPIKKGVAKAFYQVRGIQDEKYSKLNDTVVEKYPKSKLPHLMLQNHTSKPMLNDEGKPRYEFKDKPEGSSAIVSPVNLGLPYKYSPTENGLDFALRFPNDGSEENRYGYYIPDKYLYGINLTALVVSGRNNVKAYFGESLTTYEMGKIFIGVIPFKGKIDYINTVVLGVKPSLDWDRDIEILEQDLVRVGVIPVKNEIEDTIIKVTNPEMTYTPIDELSLEDSKIANKMPSVTKSAEEAFAD